MQVTDLANKFLLPILVQEESEWTVLNPLPSYGRGRDADGGRYISLIFGTNLTDVVITGEGGDTFYQQIIIEDTGSQYRIRYVCDTCTKDMLVCHFDEHVDEVQGIVEFIHATRRLKSAGGNRRK